MPRFTNETAESIESLDDVEASYRPTRCLGRGAGPPNQPLHLPPGADDMGLSATFGEVEFVVIGTGLSP